MLKFEGRNIHVPATTTLTKENAIVKNPARGTSRSKSKHQTDKRKISQPKPKNSTTTKQTDHQIATKSNNVKSLPTTKKLAISKETIILTKSQLQEILNAAGLPSDNDVLKPLIAGNKNKQHGSSVSINKDDLIESNLIPSMQSSSSSSRSPKSTSSINDIPLKDIGPSKTDARSNDENCPLNRPSYVHNKTSDDQNVSTNHPSNVDHKPTLVEQKRLQWAKEKAQQQKESDWNPWGRPGCGAPLSQGSGLRKSTPPESNVASSSVQVIKMPETSRTVLPPLPVMAQAPKKHVPPALRSSINFAMNNAQSNESSYLLSKEEAKRKWLEELEHQREEQRIRKLMENTSTRSCEFEMELRSNSPANANAGATSSARNSISYPAQFSPSLPTVKEFTMYDRSNSPASSDSSSTNQK